MIFMVLISSQVIAGVSILIKRNILFNASFCCSFMQRLITHFSRTCSPLSILSIHPYKFGSMVICCNYLHLCYFPVFNACFKMSCFQPPDVNDTFFTDWLPCANNIHLALYCMANRCRLECRINLHQPSIIKKKLFPLHENDGVVSQKLLALGLQLY